MSWIAELVARVGLTIAIEIIEGLMNAATMQDAIAVLKNAQAKTAQDYLNDAKAKLPPSS